MNLVSSELALTHMNDWISRVEFLASRVDEICNGHTSGNSWSVQLYKHAFPYIRWWRGRGCHDSETLDVSLVARSLRSTESELLRDIPELGKNIMITLKPEPQSGCNFDEMREMFKGLNDYVTAFVIGSRADGHWTPFSDYDVVVIVQSNAWRTDCEFRHVTSSLEKVSQYLQQLDPLQHHGLLVFVEHDIKYWNEAIVPLAALHDGVHLCGLTTIEITPWQNTQGLLVGASRSLLEAKRIFSDRGGMIRVYDLKILVSTISLLPALLFQKSLIVIDKRGAILKANSVMSPAGLTALRWATRLRAEWCTILQHYQMTFPIPIPLFLRRSRREVIAGHFEKAQFDSRFDSLPLTSNVEIRAINELFSELDKQHLLT